MAPYLGNGFPRTPSEIQPYHAYTKGAFHDWWIEYHDSLLVSRTDLQVRMIPIGPIIGDIIETYLSSVPITELYEDDAPHGRALLYFLASIVTYNGSL
ncbi:MAG: hypothetical protein HKN87_00315 [Saprospiraceae bacterium]|nr:hypothetical protein [Saprospiraceae bacterium]